MAISFNQIPADVRVPLVYIEFDNSNAVRGTPAQMHKILVLGQRTSEGAVAAAAPTRITSADEGVQAFGAGSMLAGMLTALKGANRYTECWAIALDDDAAAAAAEGAVTFTGTASEAGTVNLYIGGRRVRLGVAGLASAAQLATDLAAAINAAADLPVTAAVDGVEDTKVNLTAKNAGEAGNDIDLRLNYYQGESVPGGIAVAITDMTGGTANPDIAEALAVLGDEQYGTLIMPYTDAANMAALEAELAERWGPLRGAIDGIGYCAFRGDHSETGTFGSGRNSHLVSCMGTGDSPTPPHIWAAVYGAIAAASLSIDPARPLQTLTLPGILPPAVEGRWTFEERNLLLFDGIATFTVNSGGLVQIEREITMYQENSFGSPDPSYLDLTTPATLSYLRYSVRGRITQKFPRHKLADDGTRFGAGQAIVTPGVIRAELLALFREWEEAGLVENFEQFKDELLVERNANDRNRIDVLSPPDLVNQFRIFAQQTQFIL